MSRKMPDFHKRYVMWKELYRTARQMLDVANDKQSVLRLQLIDKWLDELYREKREFDQQNFKALVKNVVGDPLYPESIRTWLEDEWDDLLPD